MVGSEPIVVTSEMLLCAAVRALRLLQLRRAEWLCLVWALRVSASPREIIFGLYFAAAHK